MVPVLCWQVVVVSSHHESNVLSTSSSCRRGARRFWFRRPPAALLILDHPSVSNRLQHGGRPLDNKKGPDGSRRLLCDELHQRSAVGPGLRLNQNTHLSSLQKRQCTAGRVRTSTAGCVRSVWSDDGCCVFEIVNFAAWPWICLCHCPCARRRRDGQVRLATWIAVNIPTAFELGWAVKLDWWLDQNNPTECWNAWHWRLLI